ncbi:DNA polymerase III subunit chi [Jeongeupia naejangsanensis]|uniref:DNA polymerase III subunit chi n=1 Tax=Jeongeupia naejangsanensis TaxID=613195 RepID=A0ABS2BNM3_9NEIS|nr:DNA polymerase III subunit chi [Jeongeupia naejangsanensis]MBM3117226.1 DNA polymerase III subunit chi [Jeongeupia naejangsanensis]
MAQVTFYFNVRSREQALCQLVGKAMAQKLSISVLAASESAAYALDRLLWELPQTGFLPHCAADHPDAGRTPILVDHRVELMPARDALFNWTDGVPGGLAQYTRVIEIVDQSDEARSAARARWRAYLAHGITPEGIDLLELAAQR